MELEPLVNAYQALIQDKPEIVERIKENVSFYEREKVGIKNKDYETQVRLLYEYISYVYLILSEEKDFKIVMEKNRESVLPFIALLIDNRVLYRNEKINGGYNN